MYSKRVKALGLFLVCFLVACTAQAGPQEPAPPVERDSWGMPEIGQEKGYGEGFPCSRVSYGTIAGKLVPLPAMCDPFFQDRGDPPPDTLTPSVRADPGADFLNPSH